MADFWGDLLRAQDALIDVERQLSAVELRLASQETALDVQLGIYGEAVRRDLSDQDDIRQLIVLLKEERRTLLAELAEARHTKADKYLAWAQSELEESEAKSLEVLAEKVAGSLAFIVEGLARQFGAAIAAHNADVYALLDLVQGVPAYDEMTGEGDPSLPVTVLAHESPNGTPRRRAGVQIGTRSARYVDVPSAYARFTEQVVTAVREAIEEVAVIQGTRISPSEDFSGSPWHLPEGAEPEAPVWQRVHRR